MRLLLIVAIIFLFSSCEKNITLNLPPIKDQIVVEGYVYQDTIPYVLLSRNASFFSQIDSSQLQQYIIKGADVTLSDGTVTEKMLEIQLGQATIYFAPTIRGTPGKTYSLRVEAEGKIVTAQTFMPPVIKLDSAWWKQDGLNDTLGFIWGHLTDPDTIGNCYRLFTKRINHYPGTNIQKDADFISPFGSTTDDKFYNGKSFDFFYDRGMLPNSTKQDDTSDERGYFKRGDTIVVRFSTIDRANSEFWRREEIQVSNNGNPFSNPQPLQTNIIGGLGVWGAYSVTYDTVIAR